LTPNVPADDSEPITLIDETGVERRFRLHDAFDVQEVHYYLVEAAEDPSQVLLLRETGDGLETVDGDEFKRVMTALEEDEVE
jgi:diaminopimelate decarboxylase